MEILKLQDFLKPYHHCDDCSALSQHERLPLCFSLRRDSSCIQPSYPGYPGYRLQHSHVYTNSENTVCEFQAIRHLCLG